jgi:hypothetical protein
MTWTFKTYERNPETGRGQILDGARVVAYDVARSDANAITALRTENAKLREALEPFAKMGDTRFVGSAWEGKPDVPIIFHSATGVGVTPGDFYLARTTLGEK